MKKTILILSVLLFSLSCTKDKEELDIITFNDSRMGGVWYMSKVIQPDGSLQDYVHLCATNKDRIDLSIYVFKDYFYSSSCLEYPLENICYEPIILNFNNVTACNSKFNGVYTLNGNTLRVDYGEVRTFTYSSNNLTTAKGLIFTRN